MAKIKIKELKQLFTERGLGEGIFDIFKKKKKKLNAKLAVINKDLDNIIDDAPTEAGKQALKDLRAHLEKMQSRGTY
jgi:hypothetical protein|tara:strand:- start:525 stop:755 length:231 start_codon:yes stop_codon:yes gene_type:complete